MHAKAKTANDYVNIWPQINILNITIDAMEVYIIALSKTEENAYNTYLVSFETRDSLVNNQNNDQQSGQQSSLAVNHYNFGRRGNSVKFWEMIFIQLPKEDVRNTSSLETKKIC